MNVKIAARSTPINDLMIGGTRC